MAWILINTDRTDQFLSCAESDVKSKLGAGYEVLLVTQSNNKKAIRKYLEGE